MLEYKMKDFTNDSCIHIFKFKEKRNKIVHTHDFVEFVYVLSGSATQIINDCKFEVQRGNVVFINYKNQHSFEVGDEFEYINICLDMDFFSTLLYKENLTPIILLKEVDELKKFNVEKLCFYGDERKELETLLFGMLKEYTDKALLWEKTIINYMNIFINIILRKRSLNYDKKSNKNEWDEVVEYIEANLSEELSLSLIAQRCFYNPSYFSRIFKERFHMNVSDYITYKRIEKTKYLLRTTDMTVETIAGEVGYKNRSSLYRAFLKLEGVSIGEYRERCGEKTDGA